MKERYMYFFRLPMELTSMLRIAGEDGTSELVQDGEGQYILPATSIAGAVKSYIQKEFPAECSNVFGDENGDSKAYFYDSVCENVQFEKRIGIRIDGRTGTVKKGQLYNQYFIGQGMRCVLKIQFSVNEDKQDVVLEMMKSLISAINSKRLRFGGKKVNGAGAFSVNNAKYRVLDMQDDNDRRDYIDMDILSQFDRCNIVLDSSDRINSLAETRWISYQLNVDIPNGLLVRSGGRDSGTGSSALNMSKMVDGTERYYIPASTIKGLVRAQATRIGRLVGIDDTTLQLIFGHDGSSETNPIAGAVYAEDCLINKATETVYHRLKIDRLTGAGINGALLGEKVVGTLPQSNTMIQLEVDWERLASNDSQNGERLWKLANALVFLTLRDLGLGRLAIGSGESVGYGYMEASTLKINDSVCVFDSDARTINVGECETTIKSWLAELEVSNEGN